MRNRQNASSVYALQRCRWLYSGLALPTVLLGLASRRHQAQLPVWVGFYAGDVLWALLIYWLCGLIRPGSPATTRAVAAWLFAIGVEISQLYHAPWLEALRQNAFGALVLGRGFLTSDLLCYTLGVGVGYALSRGLACVRSSG